MRVRREFQKAVGLIYRALFGRVLLVYRALFGSVLRLALLLERDPINRV